jgi:hypothetical protein
MISFDLIRASLWAFELFGGATNRTNQPTNQSGKNGVVVVVICRVF